MSNAETALSLLESFRNGALTLREPLRERIQRIEERNATLLALREVDVDGALAQAKELDEKRDRAESMSLLGVPVAIKDNVAQAGKPNRAGRKDAAGEPAAADATIVRRLHEAGAIVLARANMDELAYGVTGSNPHTGQVRNACDVNRHPGGSSAGCASAVAAGMVLLAIGTDTAGSVRIPASLCGVVGMRPTHGWVPSAGIAPLSPSLDTAGPIARTVRDAALLLSVMTDSALLATAPDDRAGEVKALSLGVLNGTFAVDVAEGVKVQFEAACDELRSLVGSLARATIPELAGAPRASGPIIGSEASYAWQKEFEAHPDWFGEEVAGHLSKGATIKAVRYLRARDDCAAVVRAIDEAFERFDVLALPTTATVATAASDPGAQLQFLALTVPFSLGGYPAITVPMGNVDGLPTGLQLVGKRGEDAMLLALAAAFEG
jgi:aspartyl-tRNA(Asn)/glutamyl-tRNA(Gln) amidotransferase subunit A